MSLISGQ